MFFTRDIESDEYYAPPLHTDISIMFNSQLSLTDVKFYIKQNNKIKNSFLFFQKQVVFYLIGSKPNRYKNPL